MRSSVEGGSSERKAKLEKRIAEDVSWGLPSQVVRHAKRKTERGASESGKGREC